MSLTPVPQWDQKSDAVARLIGETGQAFASLSTPNTDWPRHLAALGLARCRRILEGMMSLTDNGFWDLTGVLVRLFYEAWLCSLYALHGGQKAADALMSDFKHHLGNFNVHGNLGLPGLMPWTEGGKNLAVKEISKRVVKLLTTAGTVSPEFVQQAYDRLYRGESLLNAHGKLGGVNGYLYWDQNPDSDFGVRLSGREGDPELSRVRIWMGGAMFAYLAIDLYERCGFDAAVLAAHAKVLEYPTSPDEEAPDDEEEPEAKGVANDT